jgi:hypothetical protein
MVAFDPGPDDPFNMPSSLKMSLSSMILGMGYGMHSRWMDLAISPKSASLRSGMVALMPYARLK